MTGSQKNGGRTPDEGDPHKDSERPRENGQKSDKEVVEEKQNDKKD